MYIVVVSSEKGGVGKSVLSHAIAQGFTLANNSCDAVLMHTDKRSPVFFEDDSRAYSMIDGRDPVVGYKVLENALKSNDDGLLVIDIGANMGDYSDILCSGAHLIIVPIENDYDSLREGMAVQSKHENAKFVINRAPSKTSFSYRGFKRDTLDCLDEEDILFSMPFIEALNRLSRPEPFTDHAFKRTSKHCVNLYNEVMDYIENN